jgi:hypothetical protein
MTDAELSDLLAPGWRNSHSLPPFVPLDWTAEPARLEAGPVWPPSVCVLVALRDFVEGDR